MDYFSRKSLSKYLMNTIAFNKHDADIFINVSGKNTQATYRMTLQNFKAT